MNFNYYDTSKFELRDLCRLDLDKISINSESNGKKLSLIISESATKAFAFKDVYKEVKNLSKNTSNTLSTLAQLQGFVKKMQAIEVHASVQGVFDFKSPEKKLDKLEQILQKKISFIENLFEAARTGDVEGIKNLSADKSDFNIRVDGATPLGLTVKNGHLEAAKTLIEAGAYVNFQNSAGLPPLFYVTDVGFLNLFIEKKANLNFQDIQGQTLLIHAARAGHREIVGLLIVTLPPKNDPKINRGLCKMESTNYEKKQIHRRTNCCHIARS